MHLQDTANPFVVVFVGVVNGGTGGDDTGVHTEEAEFTHIGVGGDFKRQSRKGLVVGRVPDFFFIGVRIDALDGGHIQRRRHIVNDGVQQLLHTLILIRGTAGYRNDLVGDGALTQSSLDFCNRNLFAFQILHHKLFVLLSAGFQQLIPIFLSFFLHVVGDFHDFHVFAQVVFVDHSVHFHQVDNALKVTFGPDGELDGNRITLQAVQHHVHHIVEVSAHNVHFVDIGHTGNMIFIGLTPNGFGLRLHTALGAEHRHRAVQHPQRALYFHGKVHVAGGINNIDPVTLPVGGGSGRGDGDPSLLLLHHPVHGSRTVVHLTDLPVDTGVEQDTFGGGGFTGVDVSHDTDVTGQVQRYISWHHNL